MAERDDQDRAALAIAALHAAGARFANDGTRAVLARILDDLLHRIEDRRIVADDAAAIVERLRAFCTDETATVPVRSLSGLRAALDPEGFGSAGRARMLAGSYVRLAER